MPDQPLTGHNCPGDPCTIVIFGASGDLTKRKLLPALYNLKVLRLLPQSFSIIGVAVSEGDDESFRATTTANIKEKPRKIYRRGLTCQNIKAIKKGIPV